MSKLLLALLRQNKPVFHAAAALQNIRVFRVVVALADDIRGTQLKFLREGRSACPLDGFVVVVGAAVLAPHDVHLVVAARGAADAFELGYGGNAAVRGGLVFAEGEALDFGELDFVGAEGGGGGEEGGACEQRS